MERFLFIVPNLDLGGTEMVVMLYFRHLQLPIDFVVHGNEGYFEGQARNAGAKIYRVPTRKAGLWRNIRKMRQLYKQHPEYQTVIICTEHSFAFIELAVAWFSGVRTRGAWSHFSDYQGASRLKRVLHFLTRPLMRVFGNFFLACSTEAGSWLFGKKVLHDKRFHVVKNAIDVSRFTFNPEARLKKREALGLNDHFVIGMVGRITAVKNHAFALSVFEKLQALSPTPTTLLIIGDGEEKDNLKTYAPENVIFTGAVNDPHHYYPAFDVLLLPSLHEGFPVVAVEGQAAGLPVIMSDTLSREVGISSLAQYVALKEEAWVDAILAVQADTKRERPREEITLINEGYDIHVAVKGFRKLIL